MILAALVVYLIVGYAFVSLVRAALLLTQRHGISTALFWFAVLVWPLCVAAVLHGVFAAHCSKKRK